MKNNQELRNQLSDLRKRVRKHTGIFSHKMKEFFGKHKEDVKINKHEMRIWNDFIDVMEGLSWTLHLDEMKEIKYGDRKPLMQEGCGQLVQIRPCGKPYKGKTYLGIYLGEMALSVHHVLKDNALIADNAMHNPAIFVPALKKVIFGCESWWGRIKSTKDLKAITDKTIQNIWYVKLLNADLGKKKEKK